MHQGPVAIWVLHARAAEADGEGTDGYSSLSFHLGVWLWRETQIVITYLHWSFCEFMLTYSLWRQEACCYDSIYQEAWARTTAAYTSQIEEFDGWEWVPWVGKKKQQELVCCVSLSVQGVAHCCYFGVHGPRIHWHNFGGYMSNKKKERAELGRWVESRKELDGGSTCVLGWGVVQLLDVAWDRHYQSVIGIFTTESRNLNPEISCKWHGIDSWAKWSLSAITDVDREGMLLFLQAM